MRIETGNCYEGVGKKCVKSKKNNDNLIFLKSWNEWGEGNYMEPDLKYGMSYINTLKAEIDEF